MDKEELLSKVKQNLILTHSEDDDLLETLIDSAIRYAEEYQHIDEYYYDENEMSATTQQGVIMLASYFYESRDGSTAGYFQNDVNASQQVWNVVNMLFRLGRNWQV